MSKIISQWTPILSGGTPQPLIGTLTAAAIAASPSAQTVNVNTTLTSNMFDVGDQVYVDVNGSAELVTLTGVGNNTISGIFTLAHASAVNVALMAKHTNFFVQGKEGNSGLLYLFYSPNQYQTLATYGRRSLMPNKTGFICGLMTLEKTTSGTQPFYGQTANNYGGNPDNSCFLYIDGTTNDNYLPWLDVT